MSDMAKLEIPSIVVHNGTTGSGGGGGGGGGGSPTGSGGGVVVVVGPRGHSGGCPRAMDHEQRVGGPRSGGPSLRSLRTLSKQEEFEEEDELAVESGGLSPIEGSGGGGSSGWRSSRDGGSSGDERGVPSPTGTANGLEEGSSSSRSSDRRKGFQAKHSRTSSSGEEGMEAEGSSENSEGPRKSQAPVSRMRSNSKVKLLVRSHAMREETSPPPDPEAVHRFSPPATAAVAVPSAPASPSALSVPPSGLLTVNVGSTGGPSRPSSRHRLRHQGSSQGSMDSSSPCLSRDSSTEQASLLDGGGSSSSGGGGSSGDLQQFIVETLNRNYKDRILMLKIEQEIVSLARDNKRTHHKFPPMSSYQRMLVHRVAAFFGMEHNVDSTGNAVVVSKGRLNGNGNGNNTANNGASSASYGGGSDGPTSPSGNNSSSLSPPSSSTSSSKIRFPHIEPCLRDHIRDELLPEEPRRSILKRGDSSSFEDGAGPFKSPERQLSSESRRSKSFEEREEEYEKVRKRIFNQDSSSSQEGICCCDSSGQRCSHEELHCWSGVGGGNGGGGGGGSGCGSFLQPWSSSDSSDIPHGNRGRHNQLRPSRLLKVESFESRDSIRRTSSGFRPSVSKSYSFGGYSGSAGGGSAMGGVSSSGSGGGQLTRGDSISSTHSAGGRLLTKQDSSASSANSAHLSPSSSGYKSQSVRSDSSNTPSPSPTTLTLIPASQQQHSPHDQSQGPSPSPPLLSPPLHNQTHSESQTESSPIPLSPPPPAPQNQPGTTSEEDLPGHRRNNVCSSQTRGTSPLPQPPTANEPGPSSSSIHHTVAASSEVIHPTVPLGNNAVMWAVTSMENVPPGSVLINPQTGQPYVNSDGTIYRFNPANPPKIVPTTTNTSMPVNIQPSTTTVTATTCSKVETNSPLRPLAYVCEPALGAEVASLLMPNTQAVSNAGLQAYVQQPPIPMQQQLLTTVPQSYSNTNLLQGGGDAPGAVLGPGQPQFATPASSYGGSLLGQPGYPPLQGSVQDSQKQVQENPGIAVSELASYFMGMGLAAAAAAVASSNNGASGNNGNMCIMSGPHPSAVAPAPIAMTPTSSCVTSTSAVGLHCQQMPPPTPPPLPPVNPFAVQNPSWQPSVHLQTSSVQVPFYYVAPMGMNVSTGAVAGNGAVVDGGGGTMGTPSNLNLSSHSAPPLAIQPPPPAPVPAPHSIPAPLPNPSLPPMQQQHPPGHPLGPGMQSNSQAPCIMYQQYLQSTPPPPPPPPSIVQQVVGIGSSASAPYSLMAPTMVPPERQPLVSSRPLSHTPFTMMGGGTSGAIGNGGGSGIYGAGGGDCFLPSPPLYSTFAAPSSGSGAIPYYGQGAYQQPNLPPPQVTQLNQHTPTSQQQAIAGAMIGQAYHTNQATNQIRCPTPPQHLNISNQMCYSQPQSQQNQIALSFLTGASTAGSNIGSNNSGTYYAAPSIQPHLLPGGPPGTPPPTGALLPTPPLHHHHPSANHQLNSSPMVPNPMHQQLQHHQQHHYIPPISLAPNLGLYHTNVQMVQTPPVQTPTTQHIGLPPSSATILPPHPAQHSSVCSSKVTPATKGSPSFQRPSQPFHRAISLSSGGTLTGGKAIGAGDPAAFGLRFPSVHLYGVRFVPGASGQHPALPIPGSHAVRMSPFVLHATGPPNQSQTFSPSNSSPSSPVVLSAPNNPSSTRTQRPHLASGAPPKARKQRTKSGASSSGGRSGSLSRQASVDSSHPPTPSVPDKDGSDGDSIPGLVSSFSAEEFIRKQNEETDCILTSDTAFVNGPAKIKDGCRQGDIVVDWSSSQELEISAVDQLRQPAEIKLLGCGIEVKDSVDKSLVFARECKENEGRKDS